MYLILIYEDAGSATLGFVVLVGCDERTDGRDNVILRSFFVRGHLNRSVRQLVFWKLLKLRRSI